MTKKIDLTDIITTFDPGETIADYVESRAAQFEKTEELLVGPTDCARDGYHAHDGKEAFGVSFYEWMAVDDYRACRLARLSADLPFAIYSEQHGWGVVVRPPHGGEDHCLHMHSGWSMVWYARGLECRTIIPDEGTTRFFTWEAVGKYVREERERHLSRFQDYVSPESWCHDWRPAWRLVYRMWG